ncbi:MAG TPA: tRNA lysidine(34) synthetase TilS [Steroidobacteraceae bacterium]|nr:tRNA lysidine(34) synthetase TilS [Steroidobacteraceae bacterium]
MRASRRGSPAGSFGPDWLRERLARLLPEFPDLSLCVAFSGGIDSTALLAALAPLRCEGLRLRAVHVDHGLHSNARGWSAHCRKLARELGVALKVSSVSVPRERGASLEEAARTARYRCLAGQLRPGEVLLTAHTQDDQLETVLLQLFRGSGLPGLAAMPALAPLGSGRIARPLLGCARAQLESWVRARELPWIEDDTNLDERFDRNYLRRRVLPAVRERWPGVGAAVARSARHAAEAQGLLTALARVDLERASDGAALSVKVLRALGPDRRRNLLRLWIARGGRMAPDARRLEEIAGPLIEARTDAHPRVEWGGEGATGRRCIVSRHADLLSLAERGPVLDSATLVAQVPWDWQASSSCTLPDGSTLELVRERHGPVDLDALPCQLTVTWRRGGERLRVRRGGPRRALKSLLREAHVPPAQRPWLPLVLADGALIAAADLWIDDSVRATPQAPHRGRFLWRKPTGTPA